MLSFPEFHAAKKRQRAREKGRQDAEQSAKDGENSDGTDEDASGGERGEEDKQLENSKGRDLTKEGKAVSFVSGTTGTKVRCGQ